MPHNAGCCQSSRSRDNRRGDAHSHQDLLKVSDPVAIEVVNKPGGLADILIALEKARVNVEYMYGFTLRAESKGVLAFRFDDPDSAIASLLEAGINPIRRVDLFNRSEG